jgi:hypothetical protein
VAQEVVQQREGTPHERLYEACSAHAVARGETLQEGESTVADRREHTVQHEQSEQEPKAERLFHRASIVRRAREALRFLFRSVASRARVTWLDARGHEPVSATVSHRRAPA